MAKLTWASFVVFIFSSLLISSCGGSASAIQSLQINQQSTGAGLQFTATATFNNGKHATPASVSWFTSNYATFVKNQPQYRLTSSPYAPQCLGSGSGWTVAAIAPTNPDAPASGPISITAFQDLASGKASMEDGFVAATVQITCP